MTTKAESHEGTVVTYEHEPGNGTRYKLVVADVGEGKTLVSWLSNNDNGGTAFLFNRNGMLDASYLMEKMGLRNYADAVALLVFLHQETGVSVLIPARFDSETGCWDNYSKGVVLR